jgi:hypothetical protein
MTMAQLAQQMKIQVADKVGKLAEVTDALKAAGVNIRAANAWVQDGQGMLYMVADDSEKACSALLDRVASCEMQEVICAELPDKVGALNAAAAKLAEAAIHIRLAYATVAAGADKALVVLDTSDNAKAAEVL